MNWKWTRDATEAPKGSGPIGELEMVSGYTANHNCTTRKAEQMKPTRIWRNYEVIVYPRPINTIILCEKKPNQCRLAP